MYRGYGRTRIWFIITVSNLLLVSLLGLTLRACRCFDIPVINYDHLLQAHSHFAFSGWGFMALFIVLCTAFLPEKIQSDKAYSGLFYALLLVSWGMLVAFFIQGYGVVSIIFSTLYIIISYWFAFRFYKDIKRMDRTVSLQFAKAALFFLVISTAGPLSLGFIMAGGGNNTVPEMNLIYYYLHFQYNGWFIFGLFAVFFKWLENNGISYSPSKARLFFRLMFWGCFPGYLLSVLWSTSQGIIYIIAGLGAWLHLLALIPLYLIIKHDRGKLSETLESCTKTLGAFILSVFSLKIIMQFLGAFPSIVRWTIISRILIIGYLHLVLLGIVTFSLFLFSIQEKLLVLNNTTRNGLSLFISGFIVTEVLLFSEALLNINNMRIPQFSLWIFYATILLPFGAILILGGNSTVSNKSYH
jgi:hypothetical protein